MSHAFEVFGSDGRTSGAVNFPAGVGLPRSRATVLSIALSEEHAAVLARAREAFAGLTPGGRWLIRWFPRMGTGGVVSIRFGASWVRAVERGHGGSGSAASRTLFRTRTARSSRARTTWPFPE